MKLSEKFTFGKNKGKTLANVLKHQPGYINWCKENITGFFVELPQKRLDSRDEAVSKILSDRCFQHYMRNKSNFKNVKLTSIREAVCSGCRLKNQCL